LSNTTKTVEQLATAAEKLLHETQRLRRDVANLNNRIAAFEGSVTPFEEIPPPPRKTWKALDALNMIEQSRTNILNCEHELSAIRARIDAIESDAISREEMKPWIKR
jgi:hypothetical protein